MELALPKAQGKGAGKGRKSFIMNNHKFRRINAEEGKNPTKQPNKTQKQT